MKDLFDSFNDLNALVIGDIMIDAYYWGHVERISPEAPVPIVRMDKHEKRLGGAANVALNLKSLGANVFLVGLSGDDVNAKTLNTLLKEEGIPTNGIIADSSRPTTIKTRILGGSQQVIRLDEESDELASREVSIQLENHILQIIESYKIDVIVFEDYDKGVLSKGLIKKVVATANAKNITTVVDPKKRNFHFYNEVTLFKPNLRELEEGLKLELDPKDIPMLVKELRRFRSKTKAKNTMLTLSQYGLLIEDDKEYHHVTAHVRNITDVSGAGDTVISVAALMMAKKRPLREIAVITNIAGGIVCETTGIAPIDKNVLFSESIMQKQNYNY